MWALMLLVLSQRPHGSLCLGASSAVCGGSPLVKQTTGIIDSSPVQPGSLVGPQANDSYGQAVSSGMPYSQMASRFSCAFDPLVWRKAPTSFFTDHWRYCSEKSSGLFALMYRCSMSAT